MAGSELLLGLDRLQRVSSTAPTRRGLCDSTQAPPQPITSQSVYRASGAAELPSIRGAANIGRRATDDNPFTFLKLVEIDVFVVSKPPVNDAPPHLSLAYEHTALIKGHDQIEVA